MQRKVQARSKAIQPRLESRKGKSTNFDQIGHRQANTSWQKRKTKLRSVHRGKVNHHEESNANVKEHS